MRVSLRENGIKFFFSKDVINKLSKEDLAKIFKYFGEDKDARNFQRISIIRKNLIITKA